MVNRALSVVISPITPTLRRDGSDHSANSAGSVRVLALAIAVPSDYSYFQSGSSGCFRSHSGRRLRTSGRTSKLYSGGGEVVDHSSVHASQGSSPAGLPCRSDQRRLTTKQPTPAA